jgi:hypothetical protein
VSWRVGPASTLTFNESLQRIRYTHRSLLNVLTLKQVKRMELAAKLWAAGFKAEYGYKVSVCETERQGCEKIAGCLCVGLHVCRVQGCAARHPAHPPSRHSSVIHTYYVK